MARILIFVSLSSAAKRYENAGVKVLKGGDGNTFARTLEEFAKSTDAVLVATSAMANAGWRVPADTFVVFDATWHYADDHPTTIQAKGRAYNALWHQKPDES